MFGSLLVYSGLIVAFAGLVTIRRRRGRSLLALGALTTIAGFALPARESRARGQAQLDVFMPRWQFHEIHETHAAAPPEAVFEAIRRVRADEIALFCLLTWIRRGGRELPESILNAGKEKSLIDVATSSGFVTLADDAPRELVIGTVVIVPPGTRGTLTPDVFRKDLPPGFAVAAMNFAVTPDGKGGSHVSTETRVYANSDAARRRFAVYWRTIYPGSALIRRMWLRAVGKRAEKQKGAP